MRLDRVGVARFSGERGRAGCWHALRGRSSRTPAFAGGRIFTFGAFMELNYLAAVVVAAVVVSALVHGLIAVWLRGAIVRAVTSSGDGIGSRGLGRAGTEAGDPE